jgi:EAL domain-containing protein (putative c-di-GMP-specific phosphodiesterase class I)
MGKRTVAESVEQSGVLEKLQQIGVDYAQGYALGLPVPIDELLIRRAS